MIEHVRHLEIAVLGPLVVRAGGSELPIRAGKQRQLLARLVAGAGEVVTRDQIVDALWGESPPSTSTKNLHVIIGRLRAALGTGSITTVPEGYRLDLQACAVDALSFEKLVHEADPRAHAGDATRASEALVTALALWRGDVAAEFCGQWGDPLRQRWAELQRIAVERLFAIRINTTPSRELVEDIEASIQSAPHRESLRIFLIDALCGVGDRAGARVAMEEAIDVLDREFGLSPGPDLRSRVAELASRPTASTSARSSIVGLLNAFGDRVELDAAMIEADKQRIDHVEMLDELEAMIDRGELERELCDDGRVTLVKRGT